MTQQQNKNDRDKSHIYLTRLTLLMNIPTAFFRLMLVTLHLNLKREQTKKKDKRKSVFQKT